MSSISSLSSNHLSYASRLFTKIDTDGSGEISKDEFAYARPSNVSETQSNALYDSLDTSGSGLLTLSDIEKIETDKRSKCGSLSSNLDPSMMQAMMQGIGQTGATTGTNTTSIEDMVAAMDKDGDGTVTQEEFAAARPDDVSEEMATNLWKSFDTEGVGALTTDALQTAMASSKPHGPPPPPPSEKEDDEDDTSITSATGGSLQDILSQLLEASESSESEITSFDSMVAAMDKDGDGIVTQEEFIAVRPDNVTEEMAADLWSTFDTESAGSLSTSELQTAMADNPPPAGGMKMANSQDAAYQALLDALSESTTTTAEDGTTSTTNTTQSAALQAFLEAVKAYDATAGYDATRTVLNSLISLA